MCKVRNIGDTTESNKVDLDKTFVENFGSLETLKGNNSEEILEGEER